jgi:GTPase SAR1 family protein
LLCFSIDNPDSFENIPLVWIPELKKYLPKTPIILVGNKKDLRDHYFQKNTEVREPVLREEGIIMSQRIRACTYLECSAKTREGINTIFQTAARIVLRQDVKARRRKCCNLL